MFSSIGTIPYRNQWLAAISLSVGALAAGTSGGWASPYIAKLTASDSTHRLRLTTSEASWVASLLFLGIFFGTSLGTIIQEFIGRKKTLLFMSCPLVVGSGIIIVAPTVSWLYVGRLLTGLAVGMILSAFASFMGEIGNSMIRGSLTIMIINATSSGSLLGTIMGALLPIETFSSICIALTGLFAVTFVFVPESPYYYIGKGEIQKAEESLKWFAKDADVKRETRELQDFLEGPSVSIVERINEFKRPVNQKNLLIILCITVFLYGAGHHTTNSYAEVILTKSKVGMTPSVVVMVLSFSAIIAGTLALTLVDKFGRRPLIMGSGLGLGVGHILLGSHFHMLSSGTDPESISWLPVFSLLLVYFSIPCGLATVGDTLLGELFPPMLKTPASFAFYTSSSLLSFAMIKFFQPYLDLVGEKYVFWTFAVSALCSVVFSYFVIPETKQVSLMDIQGNLRNDNKAEDEAKNVESKIHVNV